jgi:hypothetical protein
VLSVLLGGCLARQAKGIATDHAVLAEAVADKERDGTYQEHPEWRQDDLDALAEQAGCILALTLAQPCPEREDSVRD